MSKNNKHRKPKETSSVPKWAAGAGALSVGVVLPLASGTPAHAASVTVWDQIASCESGDPNTPNSGQWNRPDGDADSTGGLQIQTRTWLDYGGAVYAPQAYLATKEHQILIAQKILAAQGPGAWSVVTNPNGSQCRGVTLSVSPDPFAATTQSLPKVVVPSTPGAATVTHGGTHVPKPGSKAAIAVKYAVDHISSASYLWGGEGPTQFDCSGLTLKAWQAAGVALPHNSTAQLNASPRVQLAAIKPGDLVIRTFSSYADHVSIYVGPIGPNGEDLVDTATRHPGGGVNWSSQATRGGTIVGVVRPAPWQGAAPAVVTKPVPHTVPKGHHKTYLVVRGDSLWKIALEQLGKGIKWHSIYALNKDVVGANPDLIFPGQKFVLPGPAHTPVAKPLPKKAPTPAPVSTGYVKPVNAPITTPFHQAGSSWALGFHTGVDFAALAGTSVHSAGPGTVVGINMAGAAYGNHVVVKHPDGKFTLYAHLSAVKVAVGQSVTSSTVVGLVGSTGNATGPHLHFEVRTNPTAYNASVFSDPVVWLRLHGVSI